MTYSADLPVNALVMLLNNHKTAICTDHTLNNDLQCQFAQLHCQLVTHSMLQTASFLTESLYCAEWVGVHLFFLQSGFVIRYIEVSCILHAAVISLGILFLALIVRKISRDS